ncbi:hypothetical protein RDV39_003109 [Salmonella enterica]|nr:hypothetical protein [Salmonella enterica]
MRLTVKQLIRELRAMPQDALVVWKDHDNDACDFNDFVRCVEDISDELADNDRTDNQLVVTIRG